MWICCGWLGCRRATNSIRSDDLSTCILLVDGRALLCGRDDAKFHSSSSGAFLLIAAGPDGWGDGFVPARSSSDDEAGAGCWVRAAAEGKGLAPRDPPDTSEANGSAGGGGGVAVVCC